jgi:hypothetical protein
MNNHLFLDFETIGQDPFDCCVVNLSYYVVDWDRFDTTPYTFDDLIENISVIKADVKEQVDNYNRKIKKDDLEWWQSLPAEVRNQLNRTKNDLTLNDFCVKLLDDLKDNVIQYWWSRSNTFDPVLLYSICKQTNHTNYMNSVLKYWKVRDLRTYFDSKSNFALNNNAFVPIDDEEEWKTKFKKHHSVHDLAADILRVQKFEQYDRGYL